MEEPLSSNGGSAKRIEDVIALLDKRSKSRSSFATGVRAELQITPSIGLNRALGGGMPYGNMITVYGDKSAGKTALMLETIGLAQSEGKTALFVDAEKTFDYVWAQRLGVDTDSLALVRVNTMEEVANICCDYLDAGVDMIVIDSINALIPPVQVSSIDAKTGQVEYKAMGENRQLGQFATGMAEVVTRLNAHNNSSLIVLISQQRYTAAGMYWVADASGGNAVRYYSAQMIQLRSGRSDYENEDVAVGERIYSEPTTRKVRYQIVYNKLGRPMTEGEYFFRFYGDEVGVDYGRDLTEMAVKLGVVNKAGAWLSFGEHKTQGAAKFAALLAEDGALVKELEEAIGNL